jgi:predicted lysophospholipase L1 biosynthesis ABC-type transport system permease subunit
MNLSRIRSILQRIRSILSRIRFTVRRMIALVAVMSLLLFIADLKRRHDRFLSLAEFYRNREIRILGVIRNTEMREAKFDEGTDPEVVSGAIATLRSARARAPYFSRLADKYEHAARKP